MSEPIAPFHERLPELAKELADRGSLGLLSLDASALGPIEYEYGTAAYQEVRQRVFKLLSEQQGKDYRSSDILTLDAPRGLRFILYLDRKRRRTLPFTPADLKAARHRLHAALAPIVPRAAFPYLKATAPVELGQGLAVHNPLLHPERILRRALRDAIEHGSYERQGDQLATRERLQDIIIREQVRTAYQPILLLQDRTVLGFEALSRGPRATGLEAPDDLFGAATEHELLVELDRLCRARALLSSGRVPSNARIFINTLPATIRDPQFRGKPLIDFLDRAQVAPSRIVIEITEKLVIENYALFREAMAYYTDLGMSFAVDDVGAGYSGLESIARLKPAFLKVDMTLVRDVHSSLVNREMVKAIISMGEGIGATVIAEGIQTEEECSALIKMGVRYGQGYYLARPDPGPE
jgi:EAL domain-containing protein (putative c-di-GMP-specific phosphodiesterase class I)